VWVYIDGEKAARVTVADAAEVGLRRGLELSVSQEQEVMRRAERVMAWEMAVRLLAQRSRSRAELVRRLKIKGVHRSTIPSVIQELERLGYLDDREHARVWAEQAVRSGRAGPMAIESKLRRQGVSAEIAREATREAMAGADEEELAYQAGKKRLKALVRLDTVTRRRRLYGFLARRGFSHEAICNALARLIPTEE
jgi:regulatory protein